MTDAEAFDEAVRAKLRTLPDPVGLKTRILTGAAARRGPKLWPWLLPAGAAAAAAAALAWWIFLPESAGFEAWRAEMVKFVSVAYPLDVKSGNLEDLRQAAAKAGSPFVAALPPALAKLQLEGGCLLNWRGQKITLVCLEAEDHEVWLFLAQAMPDAPQRPQFARTGKITTVSWTDGNLTYILATDGDEAALRGYL